MLKITKASDPITVERLNVVVYGPPGLGKSTLGFTAEKPLTLDFDQGAHRALNRKDTVRPASWADVEGITADDLASYKTVVVDTAGRALDMLTASIIAGNPKMGRGGALTLQGYGDLKAKFVAWLKLLNSFGKDVVLITHMDEQRNGDEVIERLDVQGGSKGEIYKAADAMGLLSLKGGKRFITFSPSDTAFGKNPGQLEPLEVPHPDKAADFLATVVAQIKTKLNQASAASLAEAERVNTMRETFAALETPGAFDKALKALGADPAPKDKALLWHTAQAKGFTFDAKAKKFQAAPEPQKEAA